jgi:hypothetical protein
MSDQSWRSWARYKLEELAETGEPFTSDDLMERAGVPDPDHQANGAMNQVGALFREAAGRGLIVSDGRVVKSRQPHRKGGAVRVWRGSETGAQGRLL